jgi:hypothetical protein
MNSKNLVIMIQNVGWMDYLITKPGQNFSTQGLANMNEWMDEWIDV